MEDAHRENGCLWVQPGGHNSPLREIYEVDHSNAEGVLRDLDSTPWPDESEAVPAEVPAGSVILFSDHMPHHSSHNHSEHSRQALTLHVAERTSRWLPENWLQRPTLGEFRM